MERLVINKNGEFVLKKRHFKGQVFKSSKENTIITWKEVKEVVKTGEGKHDFVIKCKLVKAEEVNRAESINSYSGDVGIQNVLKKIALSGKEISSVVEAGTYASKQKGDRVVDISKAPSDTFEALNEVEKGFKVYQKMPDEMKKGRRFDDFATNFKDADFNAYIEAQVQKSLAKIQKKEPKKEEVKSDVK